MTTQAKQIINILTEIDFHIMDKTITLEELKSLILIIYKELLTNDEPNPFIKDYLALIVNHFIELEQNMQQAQLEAYDKDTKDTEAFLTHKKLTTLNEE